MLTLKYYDAIKTAQSDTASAPPAPLTPFDLDDLGADTTLKRWTTWGFGWLLRGALHLLREFWPNPQFGRLIVVTRESDVRDVLAQPGLYEVPYGLEMTELAGGTNFVLGLEGPDHDRQNAIIRSVLRPSDLGRIKQLSAHYTSILIDASGGRIDVMKDLMTRVATETCCGYFGLDPDDPDAFAEWAMSISALLFADPFGNAATRRLALNGAAQVRDVIDRAIERAKAAPETDTVVGRLVAQLGDGVVTEGEIRAILVGLVTGFIPTNTLAAGKMLEELLGRPNVWKDAIDCAGRDDVAGLEAILLEAGRLNPALAPGQWRYATADGVIAHNTSRQRRVKAGSVLMVATMSALRDKRAFVSPGSFRADRPNQSGLMFGDGAHACLGMHVAIAQITEVFHGLLKQPNLRAAAGSTGAIGWVGPFPRRLDMEFEPRVAPQTQNMIVICAPLRAGADLDGCARADRRARQSGEAGAGRRLRGHRHHPLRVDDADRCRRGGPAGAASVARTQRRRRDRRCDPRGGARGGRVAGADLRAGRCPRRHRADRDSPRQHPRSSDEAVGRDRAELQRHAGIRRRRHHPPARAGAIRHRRARGVSREPRLPRQPRHGRARLRPQADPAGSRAEADHRPIAGFAAQDAAAGSVRARRGLHRPI